MRWFYYWGLHILRIPTIVVSRTLEKELSVFTKDMTVIENGFESDEFFPEADQTLKTTKKNKTAVLCLGRGDFRKGLDLAFKAFKALETRIGRDMLEIWMIGEDLAVPNPFFEVRRFGYVRGEQLRKILSSVDILLYPTRHEGFGLLVLEAMACGCPVVTTEAVPFVSHLDNAWVAPVGNPEHLADGIMHLINQAQKREEIRENGFKTASRFSGTDQKKKLESYLESLV